VPKQCYRAVLPSDVLLGYMGITFCLIWLSWICHHSLPE